MLIENVFEVPYIDEAFYLAFCGGGKKNKIAKAPNSSAAERKALVEKMLSKKVNDLPKTK